MVAPFVALSAVLMSCGGSAQTSTVQAPMMESVQKMGGALMVAWMNMDAGCSAIEGERKDGAGAFVLSFSLPGDAESKHDTAASGDMTYVYRLRCKKGNSYSPYSDEMGMNPAR